MFLCRGATDVKCPLGGSTHAGHIIDWLRGRNKGHVHRLDATFIASFLWIYLHFKSEYCPGSGGDLWRARFVRLIRDANVKWNELEASVMRCEIVQPQRRFVKLRDETLLTSRDPRMRFIDGRAIVASIVGDCELIESRTWAWLRNALRHSIW